MAVSVSHILKNVVWLTFYIKDDSVTQMWFNLWAILSRAQGARKVYDIRTRNV